MSGSSVPAGPPSGRWAIDALQVPEFSAGLRPGLLALGLGAAGGVIWRIVRGRPLPAGGLLLVAGALWGLRAAAGLPPGLLEGLVALAGAGLAARVLPRPGLSGSILALPGAWMLASAGDFGEIGWLRAVVVAAASAGGALVADFDRRHEETGLPPVLFAVTVAGVYFVLPDTEHASVLLGASLPLLLLGRPRALAGLGSAGAYAATGLVVWTVAADGAARPAAIVGGVACLGLLVIEPLARTIRPRGSSLLIGFGRPGPSFAVAAAGHLALVYIASRWAGLRPTVTESVVIVTIEFVLAMAAVAGMGGVVAAKGRTPRMQHGGTG